LTTYTKFTFKEFRVCVRAVFAFGAGYKLGERYKLGELERRRGQSADAEAWQLGYDLSTRSYKKAYGAPTEPDVYGGRRNSEPLPGSYRERIVRPLRNPSLNAALSHLDQALHAQGPLVARVLIQQAIGAIRNSELG
jgi:hypothetical protein